MGSPGSPVGMAGGHVHTSGAGMTGGHVHTAGAGYSPNGAITNAGGAGAHCLSSGCVGFEASSGSLTYVGANRGDWLTETTYKYVGPGGGDLAVTVTSKRNYFPICVVIALLAVVVLGATTALLCMLSTPSTTIKAIGLSTPSPTMKPLPPPPPPQRKTCYFWGDPHLVTFDAARPSFYGDGEYWIVKSEDVKIQGRFMGTVYTYGLAATQKVVVAGNFLNGHKIEVEPMEHAYGGHILVDGQPVLTSFGTLKVCDGASITYDGIGELPDKAASKWESRIVHMELPHNITFTVYRWGNYLDLKLEMAPLAKGQDGSCGNFNGDPSDDTTDAILSRGGRVADKDLLFNKHAEISFTTEEATMLRTNCAAEKLVEGELACRKQMPTATTMQVNGCVFDFCFGMLEHALQTAKNYATPEDKKAAGFAD